MVADLIIFFVIYVYDFYMTFDSFFVPAIVVFINMKFIFLTFLFVFRSADFATQLLSISLSFFYIFEALFK